MNTQTKISGGLKGEHQLAVWNKTGGLCWYCGQALILFTPGCRWSPSGGFMVPDHFIAVSRGGPDELENLVPACCSCNNGKHDMTLEEYRYARMRRIADFPPWLCGKAAAWLKARGFDIDAEWPVVRFWFEENGLPAPSSVAGVIPARQRHRRKFLASNERQQHQTVARSLS